MKRLLLSLTTAALTLPMGISATYAQDAPPQFRPLEMWVCSFKDRQDQDDMNNVYEMIAAGDTAYAAWQLNGYFTGSRTGEFDFIYMGAWADNATMGADLADNWANSPEVDAAWDEVVDCQGLMFASTQIQAIPDNNGGNGNFVLTVSDCTVGHGVGNRQALGAIRQFNDYRVANGMTIGTFAWFPVYGDGDADFNFKIAEAYSGPQALGDAGQWTVDNAAYRVRGDIMEGIVACDEARMYRGRTLMNNMTD